MKEVNGSDGGESEQGAQPEGATSAKENGAANGAAPEGTVFATAAAFGKAVTKGGGNADDAYSWEHGVAVEPWPEPVDGSALLDALAAEIKRFAVVAKWVAETLAVWILHTYAWRLRDVAAYIGVESPEKRCGKSTLLTILSEFVYRPVVASNISSPAFYRMIKEKQPTLVIDEGDTVLHRNRELKGILNAGYTRKTAYVIRMTPKLRGQQSAGRNGGSAAEPGAAEGAEAESAGSGLELGTFSSWCPKAIATIKHLPDTLADRCIIVQMHRKTSQEKCERLRHLDGKELRSKCARFVADHAEAIAKAQPEIPEDLNDRAADIWEPLLVMADLAGGEWPAKARKAALALTAGAQGESPIGALLLDILIMFTRQACAPGNEWMRAQGGVRIFSRDMVASLNADVDRPWMVLRKGKEVTERWLSQQLAPYGIRPRTVWIGETSAKGYMEEDFMEAFRRYMPKEMLTAFVEEQKALREKKDGTGAPGEKGKTGGQGPEGNSAQ